MNRLWLILGFKRKSNDRSLWFLHFAFIQQKKFYLSKLFRRQNFRYLAPYFYEFHSLKIERLSFQTMTKSKRKAFIILEEEKCNKKSRNDFVQKFVVNQVISII